MDKIQMALSVVGALVLGLPAFLHAVRAFLLLIPGDPGDAAVAKLESLSQKISDVLSKLLPQSKQ